MDPIHRAIGFHNAQIHINTKNPTGTPMTSGRTLNYEEEMLGAGQDVVFRQ